MAAANLFMFLVRFFCLVRFSSQKKACCFNTLREPLAAEARASSCLRGAHAWQAGSLQAAICRDEIATRWPWLGKYDNASQEFVKTQNLYFAGARDEEGEAQSRDHVLDGAGSGHMFGRFLHGWRRSYRAATWPEQPKPLRIWRSLKAQCPNWKSLTVWRTNKGFQAEAACEPATILRSLSSYSTLSSHELVDAKWRQTVWQQWC